MLTQKSFYTYSYFYRGAVGLLSFLIGLLLPGNSQFLYAQGKPVVNGSVNIATAAEPVSVENKLLKPPAANASAGSGKAESKALPTGMFDNPWIALALILCLILGGAWLIRRAYPGRNLLFGSLPILQILGRTHLPPRQTLTLIRLDNQLILLGITDHQITPITTISNSADVSRIVSIIEQSRPASITSGFKHLFSSESQAMQCQAEPETSDLENSSDKNTENDVLLLKNELNRLLHRVEEMKGQDGP